MKVENNPISPLTSTKTEEMHSIDKKGRATDVNGVKGDRDKVELSGNARLLAKAAAVLEQTSEIPDEKIESLKRQIDDGTYQIPIENLAGTIMKRFFQGK